MATLPYGVGFDTSMNRVEIPTNTFLIDWSSQQISGMDDGAAAMRQAIDLMLGIGRFRWQIYSSNFGSEMEELIGEEYDYIVSEVPRIAEEAFSMDSRILSTENFDFTNYGNGTMGCSFDVITVFGTFRTEVTV